MHVGVFLIKLDHNKKLYIKPAQICSEYARPPVFPYSRISCHQHI